MSVPITWQNINAPDFRSSMAGMAAAGQNFDAVGANLQRLADEQNKISMANSANTETRRKDAIMSNAILAGNAAWDKTGLTSAAGEAYMQAGIDANMPATEMAAGANNYITTGLALKNVGRQEKVASNTQTFINGLANIKIDPTNTASITKLATDAYGRDIDMNAVLAHTDRVAKGEDVKYDRTHKDEMLAINKLQLTGQQASQAATAAHQTLETNARIKAHSAGLAAKLEEQKIDASKQNKKWNSDGSLSLLMPDGTVVHQQTEATIRKIAEAQVAAKDVEDNQGIISGMWNRNMSPEQLKIATDALTEKMMAEQRIKTRIANASATANAAVKNDGTPAGLVDMGISSAGTGSEEFPQPLAMNADGTVAPQDALPSPKPSEKATLAQGRKQAILNRAISGMPVDRNWEDKLDDTSSPAKEFMARLSTNTSDEDKKKAIKRREDRLRKTFHGAN